MVSKNNAPIRIDDTAATIAISTTTSGAIDMGGMNLVGLIMPAAMTGTSMTFQGSVDGTNYFDLYDSSGTQLSITIAASRFILLVPADFAAVRYLKLVSGSSEAAERSINLVHRML
jgi:hypothetical protein